MKVYIVTAGDYSSYHICGIFSTKVLAKKFINSFKRKNLFNDFNDIVTWNLDNFKEYLEQKFKPYFVRMNKEGDTLCIEPSDNNYINDYGNINFDIKGNLYNYIWAKDEEHAIKITNEKRIQLIEQDKWKK
jgi:hypothetical protein